MKSIMNNKPQVINVKINTDYKNYINKKDINFNPGVNIIIGENGSGKSSLFKLLLTPTEDDKKNISVDSIAGTFYNFDFEKDNPRKRSHFRDSSDIISKFISHGESNSKIIDLIDTDQVKDCMIFMDEPEQALDVYNINKLIKILYYSKASQINIITHHPFIILNNFNIIEMTDGYYNAMHKHLNNLYNNLKRMSNE